MASAQNVTSLARRFRTGLPGLKLLLAGDLEALSEAEAVALAQLRRLLAACADPPPELVEQAAHCGRCDESSLRTLDLNPLP